jgi:hypothetical protein
VNKPVEILPPEKKQEDSEFQKLFESALNDAIINKSMVNLFNGLPPGAYLAPHLDEEE